jgi:hypothetical protein
VIKVSENRTSAHRFAQILAGGLQPMKTFALFTLIALTIAVSAPRTSAQSCTTATCTAASVSESDFLAALPSSANKNATVVVNLPAGSATWNSTFTYAVPSAVTSLTIQGTTTVNCSGTPGTSGYSCSAADSTVINDSVTNSSTPLWSINTSSSTTLFRITGITLQPLNASVTAKSQGIVNFTGNTKNFRWDHSDIVVSNNDNSGPEFDGQIEGVLDHNEFQCGTNASFTNCIRIYNDLLDGVGNGDGGWMAATQWGSQHALFLESNYVVGGYTTDCETAGREVLRYNTFYDSQDASGALHSTKDPAGAMRGCRSLEFYHNYMSGPSVVDATTGGEGASTIEWGNTLGNLSNDRFYSGGLWRSEAGQAESEPAGRTPPNGWGLCGANKSPWDGNNNSSTGYPCLDGLGRGQQAQQMNGAGFPSRANTATGTQSWPQQYLEPIYLWMNTLPSGMTAEVQLTDSSSTVNKDVYYDCNSYNSSCSGGFTGAAGTGYGSRASRPTTCTAGPGGTYATSPTGSYGVAYFATDDNGGQGELYVCSSTNIWTPIYEPYSYPHPLVAGTSTSGGNPPAPTALTTTVNPAN